MKKILFCLLVALIVLNAQAQENKGLVRGKISDATNGEPLAGATVFIPGENYGTSTNLLGEFSMAVASGEYPINIRYLGYNDTTLNVTVSAGRTERLSIALPSQATELSGVTVTGFLQGQAQALNQQKSADNIKNIVAADQIGRFPDPNAAEALQRIPGVNIERDQGEGRYVFVRGLAPQFTNISVNGEQIPSPEADVRFVALDAIPADQLASMEVTKALTPDMDGDAIGGSVNLITRTAESATPAFSGSALMGYNNLMQKPNVQGSLQYGQRFGNNEQLGVLLNSSYYHNDLGSDNWERAPFDNELELRDYELTRTRLGLSATLDYRIGENTEVYLRGLHTRFTDREWRRRYVFIPEDEEIEKLTKDRFEAQSVQTVNLGARHIFPKIQVDYEVQYSYGEQDTPFDNEVTFIAGLPSTLGFSNPEYPQLAAPGYLGNSQYEFDAFEEGGTLAKDQNLTAKFNIGIPYQTGAAKGQIKVGAKMRRKEKSFSITQNQWEARGDVPILDTFTGGLLDDHFLDGRYQLSDPLSLDRFIPYFNASITDFELSIEDKYIDEALESYDAQENVYAAYLMARHQINQLTLLGGVRYERTQTTYQSTDVLIAPNGDLEELRPVDGESNYDFVLPQFHLKYALDRYTNLRAAVTWSYARPNFSEIIPSQEANLEDEEATVGNFDLKPVSAVNLDLLGEHYFGSVGVLSGGLFYKRLTDFIYPRTLFNSQYPLTGTPVATGLEVTQAQNGEAADLIGVEVAFQRSLDFLPGALSGLNLYLNYTYTHSRANIQSREASEENPDAVEVIRLPGQAEHLGNFSLAYEYQRFTARVAFNFNGEYLSEVGGTPEEDVYVNNRLQLDASASYTLSPKFRVFTEFMNLTNQPFEAYQGNKDVIIQREFYSWWSRIGLKFDI
uniref:TonB-dependent receptor n=1 Tax=Roseihalotalea indica TaxID=2867963 RepID=A0AA49GLL3_9BACT|nr:TonB-dependent receptor [Tunicatimonas sp. TK19036]